MTGLPGTGKSTVAAAIAKEMDGIVLSKDMVRAALFPEALVEYSTEQDEFCFHLMMETAEYLFRKNMRRLIIFDGRTFARHSQRQTAIDFAERIGVSWRLVECFCDEATAIARIESDVAAGSHPAKNRNAALYYKVREEFEPVQGRNIRVDTDAPLPASLYSNFRVPYSGEANSGGIRRPPS